MNQITPKCCSVEIAVQFVLHNPDMNLSDGARRFLEQCTSCSHTQAIASLLQQSNIHVSSEARAVLESIINEDDETAQTLAIRRFRRAFDTHITVRMGAYLADRRISLEYKGRIILRVSFRPQTEQTSQLQAR